jgi:thioredoxin 1
MSNRFSMHRLVAMGLIVCLWTIASGPSVARAGDKEKQATETVDFQVSGMTCGGCADKASEALEEHVSKLTSVKVDYDSKKATVKVERLEADTKEQIKSALGTLGFEVRFAGDARALSPLSQAEREELDIETSTHGDAIDITKHLATDKFTIVDYYADWCGPCRILEPKIERLLTRYKDIALRRVDIVSWTSDMAKQATKQFQLQAIPYVQVYGPDGTLLGSVQGISIEPIEALINRATLR